MSSWVNIRTKLLRLQGWSRKQPVTLPSTLAITPTWAPWLQTFLFQSTLKTLRFIVLKCQGAQSDSTQPLAVVSNAFFLWRRPGIGGHLHAGPLLSPALLQDCSAGSLANLRCPTCNTSAALPLPEPSVEAQSKSHLTFQVSATAHTGATGLLPVALSVRVLVPQSCLTLCSAMDSSPPGSSVHGILQARIREWIASPFSRGSSWPRDQTRVSYVSHTGRWVLYHWCHLRSPHTPWENHNSKRPMCPNVHCHTIYNSQDTEAT